jgi:hypothetical protein
VNKQYFNSPTSIVDDLLHNTPDVTIAFSEVEGTEPSGGLVVVDVGLELFMARKEIWFRIPNGFEPGTYDGMRASLCPDNPTHREFCSEEVLAPSCLEVLRRGRVS